ncbi:hypothetical protein [Cellulomonas pakistanensis]|uniref:Gram-positive cocci surface proteins LPxTG domain-containing protein n=1 Tax=Cellulomonas pakistanensis TaxID=992287 RepID=A0A919P901_9CELL|nr:hypothetical protein [Cellulomonas pakistanensis]GIG36584.1 hypothetical protein Cpa01nite_19650 [Cellulomonas pakistanensis]
MTRLRRAAAAVLAPLLALAVGLVSAAPAAAAPAAVLATAAEAPLVEGSTTTAHLSVPYPGHAVAFDLTARGRAGSTSDLVLLVDGGTGPLAAGPHALELTVADGSGRLLAQGTAAELAAAPVELGVLSDDPLLLTGTATLPAAAGDDLQGQGLTLRLTLVASQDVPPAPGSPAPGASAPGAATPDRGALAITGASALLLALVALGLVGAGVLLTRRRAASAAPTTPPTE